MRFSVIIPLYNKAPYVKRALQSVINQKFEDYELIIIDDGSTDGSFDIANETIIGSDVEYQLIHQNNSGVGSARNCGALLSHGDYFCFLDADDWWTPDFLERMEWLINKYPDAGIYGTNYYYVKNGKQRICVTTADTGYINYCTVYSEKLQMPLTSISVAIPRHVFLGEGGFSPSLKLGEDFDLWIRIALKNKVAFLNEPLAFYFQDSNPKWRGTGHLVDPRYHMLWNLSYLEGQEKTNPDYKSLIDHLRVHSLFPYYISRQYHDACKQELAKVDWDNQPRSKRRLYGIPIFILRWRQYIRKSGSFLKQAIIKHI